VPPDYVLSLAALPQAVGWKLEGGPENLLVLPCSAFPEDIEVILPVLYDEEHSAFLESRLEWLFDALLKEEEEVFVVLDAPRGLAGLGCSALSLGLRLTKQPKQDLSDGGGTPLHLEKAIVDWRAFFVTSEDRQDLQAVGRWLKLAESEEDVVRLVYRSSLAEEGWRDLLGLTVGERWSSRAFLAEENRELRTLFSDEISPEFLRGECLPDLP
jgi:hypothetical protein